MTDKTVDAGGIAPRIADRAAEHDHVSDYDRRHFLTYAALREAETEGIGWREAARTILGCDPDGDPQGARACWASHLARARWVGTVGFRMMLAAAQAERPPSRGGGDPDHKSCR